MDKKTFLDELRKSLRVLKDEELQDIIGEYEQHIDMKVSKGLTVEQAIADFGNVKELAAEILEAYHVRAEFGLAKEWKEGSEKDRPEEAKTEPEEERKEPESDSPRESVRDKCKSYILAIKGWFCKGLKKVVLWLKWLWLWFWNICCFCGKLILRPFYWMRNSWNTWREIRRIPSGNGWMNRTWRGMGSMISRLWKGLIGISLWCIRFCWNCCVIMATLFVGSLGLICLFAAGVLVVLWVQGYPFAGLTIGCVGLVLSLLSATALIWTLFWRKKEEEVFTYSGTKTPVERLDDSKSEIVEVVEMAEMEEGQHA